MEQLLKILEDNARLPIEDIATMLNKSPAEVAGKPEKECCFDDQYGKASHQKK